ncbi:MAG TPA: sigma 54-interacting transcriptional regulator [Bryobacteraceae bacterium]|jgi:formate hydrogenlyase transcriptional activator
MLERTMGRNNKKSTILNSWVIDAWEAVTSERPLPSVLANLTRVLVPVVHYDSVSIIRFQDPASAGARGDDFLHAIHLTGIAPVEGESIQDLIARTPRKTKPLGDVRPLIAYEPVAFGAIADGEPWCCNDLLAKDGWYEHEFKLAAAGVRAYVSVPLNSRGRTIGAAVFARLKPRPFTAAELGALRAVGKPLAFAAANAFAYDEIRLLREKLEEENIHLRDQLASAPWLDGVIGTSRVLRQVLDRVGMVARTEASVLITGETGTGKELIARAIHRRSPRANGPLVEVNCGALPESLIASELFGHERGAFTGAHERRRGRFEQADGGTLFLDEIGDLSAELQVTLLRVLQEREFERVGGSRTVQVNVRVLAATNRDLAADVEAGRFRADLYYRLNVFPVHLPPLRDRAEDIPALVAHFAAKHAARHNRQITRIDRRALDQWQSASWPGNIRQLENEVERAVIIASDSVLRAAEARPKDSAPPARLPHQVPKAAELGTVRGELESRERQAIEAALLKTGGKIAGRSGAAQLLGMKASTLEFRIRKLGVNKFAFKRTAA